jgi:hypothetical protein
VAPQVQGRLDRHVQLNDQSTGVPPAVHHRHGGRWWGQQGHGQLVPGGSKTIGEAVADESPAWILDVLV